MKNNRFKLGIPAILILIAAVAFVAAQSVKEAFIEVPASSTPTDNFEPAFTAIAPTATDEPPTATIEPPTETATIVPSSTPQQLPTPFQSQGFRKNYLTVPMELTELLEDPENATQLQLDFFRLLSQVGARFKPEHGYDWPVLPIIDGNIRKTPDEGLNLEFWHRLKEDLVKSIRSGSRLPDVGRLPVGVSLILGTELSQNSIIPVTFDTMLSLTELDATLTVISGQKILIVNPNDEYLTKLKSRGAQIIDHKHFSGFQEADPGAVWNQTLFGIASKTYLYNGQHAQTDKNFYRGGRQFDDCEFIVVVP